MSEHQCEFFLLRYVPDAVKDEFVNIGVVLLDRGEPGGFAGAHFARDWQRVRCLDPDADVAMLEALESEVRNRLASTSDREELLRAMSESFSASIQVSSPRVCLAESPEQELQALGRLYVESVPRPAQSRAASARQVIFGAMKGAFEEAGVWSMMRKRIAAADYTRDGDPLKIDCGYRPNGIVRMFHAVSLRADPDAAKVLAFSFPQIAEGIAKREQAKAELTAVVESGLDRGNESVAFALDTLERGRVRIVLQNDLATVAATARKELRV